MRYVPTLLSAVAFLAVAVGGAAQPPDPGRLRPLARFPVAAAVVRLDSHGASATVIASGPGRTLLLSAAHPWEGSAARQPIRFTAPAPVDGPPVTGSAPRVLRLDRAADLALIELRAGPMPYVLPVAERAPGPGADLVSVGYDEMCWPALSPRATLVGSSGPLTFTRERPWHGRSGGALVDLGQAGLVGVVQGYEHGARGRGVYASWEAVRAFLGPNRSHLRDSRPTADGECSPAPPAVGNGPDGRCPLWRE